MGATDLLRRQEVEQEKLAAALAQKKKKAAAAKFMDLEADLGSDNEENDDRVKAINRDDAA